MSSNRVNGIPLSQGFRAGDVVEVRSAEEILATLDQNGELDLMPFMPEMLQYCGKQFRVDKRADKTCDTLYFKGMRKLKNTVHLAELRCDGAAHDGCQARCMLFWKEAWLKKPSAPRISPTASSTPSCSLPILQEKCRKVHNPQNPADDIFSCQATQLLRCTEPLSPWRVGQYFRDWFTGNASPFEIGRFIGVSAFNWFQKKRDGGLYPTHFQCPVKPVEGKTPRETLDLQAGELVAVRSRDEIMATLNKDSRNRGLYFDAEMVIFCDKQYRVNRRIEKIIDEPTGKMRHFTSDCIVLDNVVCESYYHALCPRKIQAYWREIWLRRVPQAGAKEVLQPSAEEAVDEQETVGR